MRLDDPLTQQTRVRVATTESGQPDCARKEPPRAVEIDRYALWGTAASNCLPMATRAASVNKDADHTRCPVDDPPGDW